MKLIWSLVFVLALAGVSWGHVDSSLTLVYDGATGNFFRCDSTTDMSKGLPTAAWQKIGHLIVERSAPVRVWLYNVQAGKQVVVQYVVGTTASQSFTFLGPVSGSDPDPKVAPFTPQLDGVIKLFVYDKPATVGTKTQAETDAETAAAQKTTAKTPAAAAPSDTPLISVNVDVARAGGLGATISAGVLVSLFDATKSFKLVPVNATSSLIQDVRDEYTFDTTFQGGISYLFDEQAPDGINEFLQGFARFITIGLYDPGRNRFGITTGTVIRASQASGYFFGFEWFGDRDATVGISYGVLFQQQAYLQFDPRATPNATVPSSTTLQVGERYRPSIYIGLFYKLASTTK